MGLPGSGKTTLASKLVGLLQCDWFNADEIRKQYNDWDFSEEGRIRQAERMRELSDKSKAKYAICDFVCPTENLRKIFGADYTVYMNTIEKGRFEDTNKAFVPPKFDIEVKEMDADKWAKIIYNNLP
jgi:adenylylsulfate kinase